MDALPSCRLQLRSDLRCERQVPCSTEPSRRSSLIVHDLSLDDPFFVPSLLRRWRESSAERARASVALGLELGDAVTTVRTNVFSKFRKGENVILVALANANIEGQETMVQKVWDLHIADAALQTN